MTRLGIPRQALHDRLGQLVKGGLIERRLREAPGRISGYVLTERGRDFFGCLATTMRWGEQWYVDDRVEISKAEHLGCGGRFEAVLQCSECSEVLDARAVDVELDRRSRAELRSATRSGSQRHRDPGLNLLERERACPIARTLRVMGDWWSALVIREAFLGTRRFDQFEKRLGIAPNVLSERLARLVDTGVLERRAYQDRHASPRIPPHQEGSRSLPGAACHADLGAIAGCRMESRCSVSRTELAASASPRFSRAGAVGRCEARRRRLRVDQRGRCKDTEGASVSHRLASSGQRSMCAAIARVLSAPIWV